MDQANRLYEIARDTLCDEVDTPSGPRTYQERKLAGICTRQGCPNLASDDCNECPEHQQDRKKRQRRARIKNRRQWAKKRLCLRCGGRRKQGRKWCATCLIKEDRARSIAVSKPHYNSSARVTRDSEGDGYARTRYHGQSRRGQQPGWQLDEQDLEEAISLLQRTIKGLELARDAELAGVPRIQRQEVKDSALSLASQAGRFVDEVLERNRYGRNR